MSNSYRWGPLAGAGFAILFFIAFVVGGQSPNPDDSDAKIAQYLAKNSWYTRNQWAALIAAISIVLLVIFFASVRSQLAAAAGGFGNNHRNLVLAAGTACAVSLTVAVAGFVIAPVAAHDARHAHGAAVDPNLYRLTQDLGFGFWVMAGWFAAAAIIAIALAAFRSANVPRWFAWVSIVLGVLSIGSIVFVGMFAFWLWALIAGIYLAVRPLEPVATIV